jgi:hypothetical protein
MERTSLQKRTAKPQRVGNGSEKLKDEISGLLAADAIALTLKWKALLGTPPTPHLGRTMMIRVIAHRLQEGALSALKPSTLRILGRVCDGGSQTASSQKPERFAGAGTVLIREWRGVSHRVTVLDNDVD